MTENRYLNWLVGKVATRKQAEKYSFLFDILDKFDFIALHDLDLNRIADAIELRAKFEETYETEKDTRPASFLEVLISLAVRCEEEVMGDYDEGDRTAKWFWMMMEDSGLIRYDNSYFVEEDVRKIIWVILTRKYNRDGKFGLFYIPDSTKDLRKVDIWMQMMWKITRLEENE